MTVRTPLYWNGSEIQEMTSAQVTEIVNRVSYAYSTNPAVTLSVVSSGGDLGTLQDTFLVAGTQSTSTTAFPPETTTSEPTVTTFFTFSRISQSVDSISSYTLPATGYPVYYNNNGIREFTADDFYDTFIDPAISNLISSSTGTAQAGTYTIHTSTSLSGHSLVSSTPVFIDYRAPSGQAYIDSVIAESGYGAGTIELVNYLASASGRDQREVINNYYLFVCNGSANSYQQPLHITSNADLKIHSTTTFDSILSTAIRYYVASDTGSKIRYNYDGNGNTRGSVMVDTRLNGSGLYLESQFTADDYRAQEFPDGVAQTISSYRLKINRE